MITYRSNKSNTLRAAYVGSVRVGYVEQRTSFTQPGWRWQLIMLRPEGGAYWGNVDEEDEAKDALRIAFDHWLDCANLMEKTNDDTRPDERAVRKGTGGAREGQQRPVRSAGGDLGLAAGPEPAARSKAKRRRAGADR